MRPPGILELLVIGVVIIGVIVAARIIGTNRRAREDREQYVEPAPKKPVAKREETSERKGRDWRRYLWIGGLILIAIAFLTIFSSFEIVNLLLRGNIYALLFLMVGGLALYFGLHKRS